MQLLLFICGYAVLEGVALLLFPRFMLSIYLLMMRVMANVRTRLMSVFLLGMSIWLMSNALRTDEVIFSWLVALVAIIVFVSGAGLLISKEKRAQITEKVSSYTSGQLRTVGLAEGLAAGLVLLLVAL